MHFCSLIFFRKQRVGGKNARQKSGMIKERQVTPINEPLNGNLTEEERQLKAK